MNGAPQASRPAAKLLLGNTEVGIETRFKNAVYADQVYVSHVPDMQQWKVTADGVHIGAAVNLTQINDNIDELVRTHGRAACQHFLAIQEQLRWFASRQVQKCFGGWLFSFI